MVIRVSCDMHRLFSLEIGTRGRTSRLFESTGFTVGSTVGAAENSPYLPGPNLMPSKAPFKTGWSFIFSINR